VRGEGEFLADRAEDLAERCDDDGRVADDDNEVLVGSLNQQPAVDGLRRLLGHRGEQDGLVAGEAGGRVARHRDVQVGGDVPDQRRGDAVEDSVLRPVQLGGRLVDRKQRRQDRQRGAQQSGDDGNQPSGPIVRSGPLIRPRHGGRW